MKVTEHLAQAKNPIISVEIIPPKRGGGVQDIYKAVESIVPYNPAYIDVTSHSAEVQWDEMPDGTFKKRIKRKRPGTIGLCAAIKYKYNIDPVPHILCAGFTREETEDALIELDYLGIENVLAIQGDANHKKEISPDKTVNEHADDLVEQVTNMNKGIYQDELINPSSTNFDVGVAAYPEKHFESPNRAFDLKVLKRKQDLGANYAVTQMFFDNKHYFDFVQRARNYGITIPIIPGLKILTSKRQLSSIPRAFFVDIPEELADRMMEAKSRSETISAGIDWAVKQSVGLLEGGVKNLHFYIMQNTKPFIRMRKALDKHL